MRQRRGGVNERGFSTLYNVNRDTMVIVRTKVHERPRNYAAQVAEAAVNVTP